MDLIKIMDKIKSSKLNEEQLQLIKEYNKKDRKLLNIALITVIAMVAINPFLKNNSISLFIIIAGSIVVFSYLIVKIFMKFNLYGRLRKLKNSTEGKQ